MRSRVVLAVGVLIVSGVVGLLAAKLLRPTEQPSPSAAQVEKVLAYDSMTAKTRADAAKVGREPARPEDQLHQHAALRIIIDHAEYHAPRELGLIDAGMPLALHAHDNSGVVHLHQPKGDPPFTLAQMMQVWGVKFSGKRFGPWQLGDADGEWRMRVWVNGRQQPADRTVHLSERTDVVVELASPGVPLADRPPSAFDWNAAPINAE